MEPNENERLGNKIILASDQVRIWEHRVPRGETGERPISIVARTCRLSFEAKPGTPSMRKGA